MIIFNCFHGKPCYSCNNIECPYREEFCKKEDKVIDPFDAEFLSQELRDSWKKIEELEKENKELREKLEFYMKNYNPYWAGEDDE